MCIRLQNYDIQVEYKKGETTFLADILSRAYLENELLSQTQDSDVRSIREQLFAFELEQIKHGEYLSISPLVCKISARRLPRMKNYRFCMMLFMRVGQRPCQELTNMTGVEGK